MQIERRPGVRHRLGGDVDFGLGLGDRFRTRSEFEQNQLGLCRLALQAGLLEDLLSVGKLLRRDFLPSGQRTQAVDDRLRVLDGDFSLCDGQLGGPALLNPRLAIRARTRAAFKLSRVATFSARAVRETVVSSSTIGCSALTVSPKLTSNRGRALQPSR